MAKPMNNLPQDPEKSTSATDEVPAKQVVQDLVRAALKGSLATTSKASGDPYASLVTCATTPAGNPIFLLSQLAVHTQNLNANARASLLIDGTGTSVDALTGNRATFIGAVKKTNEDLCKQRFLARHPSASFYAGFEDFDFYIMDVESVHFIGGFGRIIDIPFAEIALKDGEATALVDAEPSIIEHMNEDHSDALNLYASYLLDLPENLGPWRMSGIDPHGLDIIGGGVGARLNFDKPVPSPNDVRAKLRVLSELARARRDGENA